MVVYPSRSHLTNLDRLVEDTFEYLHPGPSRVHAANP
ncbi:hypothetical protein DFR68_107303 [Nocardia mexicana]|uniref:Uncharacterized protein n=1 Tax=Nocardia mexicana TaxID=279262 RepID=A0A370GZT0_9NOCA|nr:hypothetical protein DFR68_107303 [Nocardia mexicana]